MNLNSDIFRIKTNNVEPEKGRILIAEPFLPGSYFNRSIILLASYSEKGAVGFILNKPVDFPIRDLFDDLPGFDTEVYLGGPVSTDSVYFIHSLGDRIPGSTHIKETLYWGGDIDVLKDQIRSGAVATSQIRFFIGYSGWAPGQLEEEIRENSWLVSEMRQSEVMRNSEQELWEEAVKAVGGKYSLWLNYPENPSLN
ncbi:MAG: YqgE/AlgH family protein [Prolixibacteraceae bacterium]|jgi:putative transcriptional regulator|nr:YqgE/AlgH family protein [Prolixibacteraceae bacterium]